MSYDSKIYLNEIVENKQRKFGSQKVYYSCKIIFKDGTEEDSLFTKNQIEIALKRGLENKEDFPEKKSFWDKLWNW